MFGRSLLFRACPPAVDDERRLPVLWQTIVPEPVLSDTRLAPFRIDLQIEWIKYDSLALRHIDGRALVCHSPSSLCRYDHRKSSHVSDILHTSKIRYGTLKCKLLGQNCAQYCLQAGDTSQHKTTWAAIHGHTERRAWKISKPKSMFLVRNRRRSLRPAEAAAPKKSVVSRHLRPTDGNVFDGGMRLHHSRR